MKNFILFTILGLTILGLVAVQSHKHEGHNGRKIISIANYGPHHSLNESIRGMKDRLKQLGYKEGDDIEYHISDVNFQAHLIPQMITNLKSYKPDVLVALTTPVAQNAKRLVKNTPIVFNSIDDAQAAGLLANEHESFNNITGVSDRQNLDLLVKFIKETLPNIKSIGFLYSLSEANDQSQLRRLETACNNAGLKLEAVAIDQPRDLPIRMKKFKNKVGAIYIGMSGPIQPSLPVIVKQANKMHIPVFNAGSDAVKNGMALASYSVDYHQLGINTAQIIKKILDGEKLENIKPLYPQDKDHKKFINITLANKFGISIPKYVEGV